MRWAHNYSTAEIHLFYTDKIYQIQLPVVQAAILLLFDSMDTDRIKITDLHSNLQLTLSEPRATSNSSNTQANSLNELTTSSSTHSELELLQKLIFPLIEINLINLQSDLGEHCEISNPITVSFMLFLFNFGLFSLWFGCATEKVYI